MSEEIAHDLREFMLAYVESYEQLEILLLLHREATAWQPPSVADALELPLPSATASLDELAGRGLLRRERGGMGYRFDPADPAVAGLVARLARAYEERRVAVIGLMSANAMDRIRKSALRTFAEAFRLKRTR